MLNFLKSRLFWAFVTGALLGAIISNTIWYPIYNVANDDKTRQRVTTTTTHYKDK